VTGGGFDEGGTTFDSPVVKRSFCGHHSHSADIDSTVDIGPAHFGGHGNLAAIGATLLELHSASTPNVAGTSM
jgi:hypothetical protein